MAASSTFTVERHQRLEAPPSAVLERIVNFRRWAEWSPWEELDPDLERRYSGAESGVGAVYEWKGNRRAGEGRMEVRSVDVDGDTDGDGTVTIDLRFLKPFKSHNTTVFRVRPDGTGSTVTWSMTGPNTLMTRVMGVFKSMDKMIGPDFEKGLARLKAAAEGG